MPEKDGIYELTNKAEDDGSGEDRPSSRLIRRDISSRKHISQIWVAFSIDRYGASPLLDTVRRMHTSEPRRGISSGRNQ